MAKTREYHEIVADAQMSAQASHDSAGEFAFVALGFMAVTEALLAVAERLDALAYLQNGGGQL